MPIERFLTNLSRSHGFSIRFYATGCGMHLQRVPYFQMFWLTSPCGEAAFHGFNQFYSHWRFRLLRRCYGLAPLFQEHNGSQLHICTAPDAPCFVHLRSGAAALQLISHRFGLVRLAPCSLGVTHFMIQGTYAHIFDPASKFLLLKHPDADLLLLACCTAHSHPYLYDHARGWSP